MAINNVDMQDYEGNSYWTMANPDSISEFTKATTRTNIASGDTHRTIFGKICKFFADLGTSAFSGLANNLTTTAAGYGMDARQGPVIQQKFDQINSNLDGNRFGHTADGRPGWKDGADTVHPFMGEPVLLQNWNNTLVSGTITQSYTASADISLIVSVMAVTGNDTATPVILYVAPIISISGGTITSLSEKNAGGYNTNLKCGGIGAHKVYLVRLKAGNTLTITIKPYGSQFQTGYDISLFKL
nr:MAG TPA: hypothetical protein [Caudoviricetes sp.]